MTYKRATWLGVGCSEGKTDGTERPVALARCGRIQSPHSTDAAACVLGVYAAKSVGSKTTPREGGRKVDAR